MSAAPRTSADPPRARAALQAQARARAVLPIVIAIAGVLAALNLISFAFGSAPSSTLRLAFEGTWGTSYGVGQVLFKASPLLMTGLAFDVAFRAGLFNIGAEGQLAVAGLVGACVAQALPRGASSRPMAV